MRKFLKIDNIINSYSPAFITFLLLLACVITSFLFFTVSVVVLENILNSRDVIAILQKLSPMILPSIIASVSVYQNQYNMRQSNIRDAKELYNREQTKKQIEGVLNNQANIQEELLLLKEQEKALENVVTAMKTEVEVMKARINALETLYKQQ